MTISMYQASVPSLIRAMNNLVAILEKGAAHAQAKNIDPAVLINSRLYPDMFPLGRQVQIASDIARRGAERLAGLEASNSINLLKSTAIALQEGVVEFVGLLLQHSGCPCCTGCCGCTHRMELLLIRLHNVEHVL